MKLFKTFLNDSDGFSAKDYLMVTFGTIFVLMVVTAFIVSLVTTLPAASIAVIQLLDGVMITIVGGVFGIQGIKEFRKTTSDTIQSDITPEPTYTEPESRIEEDNSAIEEQPKLP